MAASRLILLGAPLVLGVMETGHPALLPGENIVETLAPISTWWTILHVAQVPLFALMGWAVLLLVRELEGRAARISRVAIAIFIVVYPAFDAAVGVASGVIVHTAGTVEAGQRAALEAGLQALFWGPVTGLMAVVGSACWFIALTAAAWAWRRAGAPWYVVGALALSGLLLGTAHIRPLGPLACLFLLVAGAWVSFRGASTPRRQGLAP